MFLRTAHVLHRRVVSAILALVAVFAAGSGGQSQIANLYELGIRT
jgi:hypothetical protein